ncbi:MAG: Pectate lyase superfamily protein, partial [Pedosphaera sp.]|nr:Pectate lyase superfamily protein [Pedosphaera sp.]
MYAIDMVRFGLLRGRQMCLTALLVFVLSLCAVQARPGATVPWTTYEAEAMTVNGGTILGPPPRAVDKNVTITNTVEAEASGRLCVKLSATGHYVEFAAQGVANTLVVRYSVPDTADGTGADYTLSLYVNGTFVRKVPVTSKYSWLYGAYTFSNTPGNGSARNYYDEARLMNLSIGLGDQVRLQVDADDAAAYYVIDLVDLENIAPPLSAPPGSRSVLSYGAVGNGTTDDTIAISNCVAGAGIIWFPPGNYLVTRDINVTNNTTIQGAGMWYTTFVGSPATYVNEHGRVRFNGAGTNLHFADFAIVGKLNNRNDSHANDGFSEIFGNNSSISRVWVEHTKTGAWLANATGMVIADCRFRNTIADGINLSVGMNHTIVTNCTARNTGDDSFAMWPATYRTPAYEEGFNVFTHCTAQTPFFANSCGIYGGNSNGVEDCLFQDIPNGAGILIAGTFPIGTNAFRGTTFAQRCDLNRCGGNDPGWRWRGALTLCPDGNTINGLQINNLNISNSLSYAVQVLHNTLSNATMSDINVHTYAVGVPPYHPQDPYPYHTNYCDGVFGVLADGSASGSINVNGLSVNGTNIVAAQTGRYETDCIDKSTAFAFNFSTTPVNVTVQANPTGHSFLVDGVAYTNSQIFTWIQGSTHTLAATSPQNTGAGVQDAWTSWSDGGALSHTVSPVADTIYTANFATQYYLTMNAGTGGSISPSNGWFNSGSTVSLSATPTAGYSFTNWAGSGSGSYSGTSNQVSIAMNGPIGETASFFSPLATNISVLVQANLSGHSFSVDGVTYTNSKTFIWTQGSAHALAATSPQNTGAGVQDAWTSWSDGGALSHSISPMADITYTINFTTQYNLTMNAGTGGSVSPGSGWFNSGSTVILTATPAAGFAFLGWAGSGSYSGTSNPVSITMNGPIGETASFFSPPVQSLSWVQQPANVLQGAVISPEVQLQAIGTNGQSLAGSSVTLSLASGTGNLTGTLIRSTDANGIAHFNDLKLNQAGTKTFTAAASAGSAPTTNSNPFTVTALPANTYTATNNAGWNTASTWDPNGIPGAADIAIIPAGRTVTYAGTPATVGTILISGTFSPSTTGTLGDVWVDTTGNFNVTGSGANLVFSGSVTNLGLMPITSLGSATAYTYSGAGKFLAGNISNVVANFTGSYQNVGTFVAGLKGNQNAFKGTGAFTNSGVLILASGQNTTPTVGTLDCSAAGNLVVWTNFSGTAVPEAATYYDVIFGQTGSSAWNLSGATISHNLTLTQNGPISAWPVGGSIGGKFTYASVSTTASTLPAAFSVGGFAQTAGKVTLPAGGTLTVTGTGAGVWSQAGGALTAGAGGTVKFTGPAPEIGGAALNNLVLDATAANATAGAAFFVTNTLTVAAGASLDVTALPASTYTLSGAQSLLHGGTLKGALATVSGSKVYAGTDGAYATGTVTGDLTLAAGSTVNLDVNNAAAGANDSLVVGGAVTLNNNTFNLKAPSAGAAIDTAGDYTLVTAASISGTPLLHWVTAPADTTNYTLVVSATAIKLHYGGTPVVVGQPTLSYSLSGGVLTLSWDATTFPGFTLQEVAALGGAWTPVANGNVSPVILPINPAPATAFFRLSNP